MTVLRDLDKLEARWRLDPGVPVGQGGVEMRRVNLAIVTHNRLASDHLRSLVATLVEARAVDEHFARCSYELGGCETPTEDDGLPVFCDTYNRLEQIAIASRTAVLFVLGRALAKALEE